MAFLAPWRFISRSIDEIGLLVTRLDTRHHGRRAPDGDEVARAGRKGREPLRQAALRARAARGRLVYELRELRLDAELTFGEIVPYVSLAGRSVRVPEQLARLTMRRVSDGHWLRESWLFGVFYHAYDLRRIVRGDGWIEDGRVRRVRGLGAGQVGPRGATPAAAKRNAPA
ncbi:hypothetical protein WMF30_26525 [Sorangium sp. So ce134]